MRRSEKIRRKAPEPVVLVARISTAGHETSTQLMNVVVPKQDNEQRIIFRNLVSGKKRMYRKERKGIGV